MDVSDFDFDLPKDLIAAHPARPRDSARLLEIGENLTDRHFRDLPGLLRAGDVMVFNDTRVIPARLTGVRRRGAAVAGIEVTLHRRDPAGTWRAFARPAKRLRPGDVIAFAHDLSAEVAGRGEGGEVMLRFVQPDAALPALLERHGAMPMPPYLGRPKGGDPGDREDYQTVYAARDGAVAAPTAGLHFTPALLDAIAVRGVRRVFVTLHVGAGTFLPVTAERVEDHVMHAEYGEIGAVAAREINGAHERGGRLVAVGTTSLRLLEAAADADGRLRHFAGETDIFITPGYRFKTADMLLTNFHLPRSTLFMLASAFAGRGRMRAAYRHAVERGYRFYSYGDACLLHRAAST